MRGFTLIESIVYIGIFGIILSGMLSGLFALSEFADKNETRARIEFEGSFLLQKIAFEIQNAQTLQAPSPIQATSSELDLLSTNNSSVQIIQSGNSILLSENNITQTLSSDSVEISDLTFSYATDFGISSVQTSFLLVSNRNNGIPLSQVFSTITYLSP